MRRGNLLFIAAIVTSAAATGLVLAWTVWGWDHSVAIDDLGELVAAWVAACSCGVAAWRHQGRARWAWAAMGASAFAWGAGEAVWSWYELGLGQQVPFPSLADAGYLAAVPLAALAAMLFPGIRRDARARLASGLDGLMIGCALLALSWVSVLHTVESAGADSMLAQVLSIAYPAGDVLIATMLATLVARMPSANRLPLILLITGLAGNALSDSSFAYLTAQGTYGSGSALDTGWFAGYVLLALGALRAAQRPAVAERDAHVTSRWQLVVPYVPLLAAVGAAAYEVVDSALEPFVFWLLTAMIALVVSRQFLTLSDNHALLRHLGSREAEMRHRAYHDPLTELPNRALFQRRLEEALEPIEVGIAPWVAVLVIDLDDFKDVNDTLGHDAGDRLLVEVGTRLQSCIRATDMPARLGGDEFAVVLSDFDGVWHARHVAERLVRSLHHAVDVEGGSIAVHASVGVAVVRAGAVAPEELLRRADLAMYRAKGEGKGRYVVYDAAFEIDAGTSARESAG